MARLSVTPQDVKSSYPTLPIAANGLDFTWVASGADFAQGFGFPLTGREVLLVRNDNVGAQTVTISSVVDEKNRSGDITTYSVGIGEYAVFPFFRPEGWRQSDGKLYGAASAADMFIAVLRLPA